MAYIGQDTKAKIAPVVKEILKRYGMKGTLAIRNHTSLELNIKSGKLDILGNYNAMIDQTLDHCGYPKNAAAKNYLSVNHYWLGNHYNGRVLSFLREINAAMNVGNHDNSDIQSDYFDVGWYVNINVGRWDRPYILER